MRLTWLALSGFRNYEALEIEPSPGLNAFVGPNAQGKSNLLEAIAMLGTGRSFRTARDGDAVRSGGTTAAVRGEAQVAAGPIVLACTIVRRSDGVRKTYTLNGRDVRYPHFLGKLRVVSFVPADLQLAGGPPSLRRAFANAALSQEDVRYYAQLAGYRKALQQKNALLRAAPPPDPELLSVYDAALVAAGTYLVLARVRFAAAMADEARRAHARFTRGRETLDVAYEPNVPFASATERDVSAALEARLRELAPRERARGGSLAGPHRDDLGLTLDGRSLAAFGSQGQQRTAVLALKVAEYAVGRARAGEAPLLLLDDVLSELDEERSAAFLAGIGDYEQAFITATHVPTGLPGGAWVFPVSGAQIAAQTPSLAC